jgi:hypothetical protein
MVETVQLLEHLKMTSDNKPGRDLALWQEHVPARIDRSKSDTLLERARVRTAVAKPSPIAPPPAIGNADVGFGIKTGAGADLARRVMEFDAPNDKPAAERVLVAMTCSTTGKGFPALAERRVNEQGVQVLLLLGGGESPAGGAVTAEAGKLSGAYDIERAPDWRCPLCNSNKSMWTCTCPHYGGTLHCGGSIGSLRYCACGKIEERDLIEMDVVEVRGRSLGAASRQIVGGLPTLRSTGVRSRDR